MDISQLEVFLSVAQQRSFSRAAESLHRTQPAVSQAVRRLEAELGESLFDRSSKDGTLTAAGKVLFDFAQQMMNQAGGITAQSTPGIAAPPPAPGGAAPELLNPAQVAQMLGVAEPDVLAILEAGDLKGKKIGTQWRVTRAAVDNYLRT